MSDICLRRSKIFILSALVAISSGVEVIPSAELSESISAIAAASRDIDSAAPFLNARISAGTLTVLQSGGLNLSPHRPS